MRKFAFILLTVAGLGSILSCSKYEEGSNFTLLTKKMRLANEWTLTSATVNGVETFDNSYTYILMMEKDGKGYIEISNEYGSDRTYGTWELSGDKEDLILTDDEGNITVYEIVQLKNKDLKLRQTVTFFGYNTESISTFKGE